MVPKRELLAGQEAMEMARGGITVRRLVDLGVRGRQKQLPERCDGPGPSRPFLWQCSSQPGAQTGPVGCQFATPFVLIFLCLKKKNVRIFLTKANHAGVDLTVGPSIGRPPLGRPQSRRGICPGPANLHESRRRQAQDRPGGTFNPFRVVVVSRHGSRP